MTKATVAIVIPCQNEARYLERLLEAVRLQDVTVDEVVLVDSQSHDASVEIALDFARRHPGFPLRVVDCPVRGAAAAMNAGIGAATADIIVRLDGHCEPPASYVRQCIDVLAEQRVGVSGGVWDIRPTGTTLAARGIAGALAHKLGTGAAAYRHSTAAPVRRDVDTVPYGTYTKAHWAAIGGYTEALLTNEDYEFNYRTRLAGLRVVLDTGIRCQYFSRPTLRGLAVQVLPLGLVEGADAAAVSRVLEGAAGNSGDLRPGARGARRARVRVVAVLAWECRPRGALRGGHRCGLAAGGP